MGNEGESKLRRSTRYPKANLEKALKLLYRS